MKSVSMFKVICLGAGAIALAVAMSCGGGVQGTYSDPTGAMKIELKSGNAASLTMLGETHDCTYTVDKKAISLDCKQGSPVTFTLSDDGTSLQSEGGLMPPLKKK